MLFLAGLPKLWSFTNLLQALFNDGQVLGHLSLVLHNVHETNIII